MSHVTYIAAPFSGPDKHTVRANIRRALCLGRLARVLGYAPIVPHIGGPFLYGEDSDPKIRERVLEDDLSVVELIARGGGAFWCLTLRSGALSAGCRLEINAWRKWSARSPRLWTEDDLQTTLSELPPEQRMDWLLPWHGKIPTGGA